MKSKLISGGIVAVVIVGVGAAAIVPGMLDDASQDRIVSYGVTEAGHPIDIEKVKESGKTRTKRFVIYEFTVDGTDHQVRGEQVSIGVLESALKRMPDRVVYYNPDKPEEAVVSAEEIPGTGGSEIGAGITDMKVPTFDELQRDTEPAE
ncbi:DUF3592 domain-containing protein [Glaciibacter psychrotolerans]|uniref:DUF3592 domain-containing protein n=1 Tax=Glaciibacter psychrotolerans TaxID=670054 RepID=A0A7Z0EGC5_9MICO|nr:hypothetical protein [Leifsonia psychrotolerans]NYJ20971.1 hypothetical protein [Leifsonia psychrotolerans]